MKLEDFKTHKIERTPGLSFDKPGKYRKYLSEDFAGRCCYCNTPEDLLTSAYHIDHFIPRAEFSGVKDYLNSMYDNLMWSCPKCNLAKSNKYEGNLSDTDQIENLRFYNPVETDYNDIFYRNELGAIDSDDPKGRQMIRDLKLYRPVHTLSWLIEKLESTYDVLEKAYNEETDKAKRAEIEKAKHRISEIYMQKNRIFRAVYKDRYKPRPEDFEGNK